MTNDAYENAPQMNQNTVTREECEAIIEHNPSGAETQTVRLARAHLELLDAFSAQKAILSATLASWARAKNIIERAGELSTGWKHGTEGRHLLAIQLILSGSEPSECELRSQKAALEDQLAEYAGWAPDQFLRYQEEHRKLQESYRDLDQRRFDIESQLAGARILLKALGESENAALIEARKDTERLVFLVENGLCVLSTLVLGEMRYWLADRDAYIQPGYFLSARAAIDAAGALRAKPEAVTPE